jgi:hypothetical protein
MNIVIEVILAGLALAISHHHLAGRLKLVRVKADK